MLFFVANIPALMNKPILYILSAVFLFLLSLGASGAERRVSLSWQGVKTDSIVNGGKYLALYDGVAQDATHLPFYSVVLPLDNNRTLLQNLGVKNVKYAALSEAENGVVNGARLDTAMMPQVYYTIDRKQKKAVVSVLPIVFDGTAYKKVLSFDLTYEQTAPVLLKSALVSADTLHAYAGNSVLASGSWIKISVPSSGVYKITYEDLVKWGVSNPANAHVFGYGGAMLPESFLKSKKDDLPQVSIYKSVGADGVFSAGDYLLFYAQGPVSWSYNTTTGRFAHTLNPYSSLGYYFISSDNGTDKIMTDKALPAATPDTTYTSFLDYQNYETESENILQLGRTWYGEIFTSTTPSYSFDFDFPNTDTTQKGSVSVAGLGANTSAASTMTAYADGTKLGSVSFLKGTYPGNNTFSFTPTSTDGATVSLTYNNTSTGKAYLDYIDVNVYRRLVMSGSAMPFRMAYTTKGNIVGYRLEGNSGLQIWDVTDPENATLVPASYSDGSYAFTDDNTNLTQYVAVNPSSSFSTPTYVGAVSNQNLHALGQVDYVIITHPDYLTQAQTLAKKHASTDGISTAVVTTDQVYNEFSSGTPDATAYRWLMKMLYDRAADSTQLPRSLLLFGDGSYDNKGILAVNKTYNKVLTFQDVDSYSDEYSYVTDDYYGLLDDSEGTHIPSESMDIGVGRLPVHSADQATVVVNKISTYMDNAQAGDWKNKACFMADDDDNSTFTSPANVCATYLDSKYPNLQTKRIFLDGYTQIITASGQSYPEARQDLFNWLKSGLLVLDYSGHGSMEGMANERVISRTDAINMVNAKWPFLFTATCNFGEFDYSANSAGEEMLYNPLGGAIGMITAARTVHSDVNDVLNNKFVKVFPLVEKGSSLTFGEITRRTKNNTSFTDDKLSYALLGDPAVKMPIATNIVTADSVKRRILSNGIEVNATSLALDTIGALSTVTIKGRVLSSDSVLISNFNGFASVSMYDKKDSITTLGNESNAFTYVARPNLIYSGKAQVTNGQYSITFLVPKDIAYNYGTGRLNLYAADTINHLEANGYNEGFILGSSDKNYVAETSGPIMSMYLNSPYFASGDEVDASSILYATVSDESGINATGAGIGHDILLMLSGTATARYVLNDYYVTDFGSYKSGSITYPMDTLSDGDYTLTLRVWDMQDNSTSQSINFRVGKDKKAGVYHLMACPNPVSSDEAFRFRIDHDQPQTDLNITIKVYNLNGSLLWQTSQTIYAQTSTTYVDWDLKSANGEKLVPGVYLYRFMVGTDENATSRKTSKLVIK